MEVLVCLTGLDFVPYLQDLVLSGDATRAHDLTFLDIGECLCCLLGHIVIKCSHRRINPVLKRCGAVVCGRSFH